MQERLAPPLRHPMCAGHRRSFCGPPNTGDKLRAFITLSARQLHPLVRRPVRLCGGPPLHGQLPALGSTVAQVQVDQSLVADARGLRQRSEVLDRNLVYPQRDLPLQPASIGILLRLRKVVVLPHRRNLSRYCLLLLTIGTSRADYPNQGPLSRTQWQTNSTRRAALRPSRMNRSSDSE